MLYNGNNPILQIVGVEHLRWSGGTYKVAPREFSALAFRIKGSAAITSHGKRVVVNSNDILYLPQNMGYTAKYTDTEMIVVHFTTRESDPGIQLYSLPNSEEVYKQFLQIHSLWEKKEPGYPVFAMAQFYNILGTVFKKETKTNFPPYFLKAMSFIHSNYKNSSLSIHTICTDAGISETAFRQLFKKYYQKTPLEYIQDLRLEYARNLIAGDMSVELAALESGFNDPKYFARVVKKRFGCTPRSFRNYGK